LKCFHKIKECLKLFLDVDIIKVLEDGDLETMGRESYEGRLGPAMTAHPKLDPVTGNLTSIKLGTQGLIMT